MGWEKGGSLLTFTLNGGGREGGSLRRVIPLFPGERRPLFASLCLICYTYRETYGAHTVSYTHREAYREAYRVCTTYKEYIGRHIGGYPPKVHREAYREV